jgi:hypothetical protein
MRSSPPEQGASRIEPFVQVGPFWIRLLNQRQLPEPRPVLEILFPLQGVANIVVKFAVRQTFESVPLRKPVGDALAMFPHASSQIAGDADIERALRFVRHDVHIAAPWPNFTWIAHGAQDKSLQATENGRQTTAQSFAAYLGAVAPGCTGQAWSSPCMTAPDLLDGPTRLARP